MAHRSVPSLLVRTERRGHRFIFHDESSALISQRMKRPGKRVTPLRPCLTRPDQDVENSLSTLLLCASDPPLGREKEKEKEEKNNPHAREMVPERINCTACRKQASRTGVKGGRFISNMTNPKPQGIEFRSDETEEQRGVRMQCTRTYVPAAGSISDFIPCSADRPSPRPTERTKKKTRAGACCGASGQTYPHQHCRPIVEDEEDIGGTELATPQTL